MADTDAPDIELPACFYLGREYDVRAKTTAAAAPILYDARDLLTHAVIVGMTGSGKTGLGVAMLEEAAIDGIPCIIIDPKGDLTNLLLHSPGLAAADFARWANPEDARRKNQSIDEYGASLSRRWADGLRETGQGPERVARLGDAAEYAIYTPGSSAGLPLSVLRAFAPPPNDTPREAVHQRVDATASALLGLTGVTADPVQSREHVLIAQILLHHWGRGESLDLAGVIRAVQNPPFGTVGAFDVETFLPEKQRLKLAVGLNNLLASPGFMTWLEGDPLDLETLLKPRPKTRHLIFYLAHLDDSQRMFFLALLLEEVLAWTRRQPGTTLLRAILYFDEVFGYLPPYPANPPSKPPLMTLLKQARAFGVGVVLATQNPVDLDYKALSNAGTWMVGKLQTERDKARLLDGLEGVAAERGTLADRKYLETVIASLGNRVFLLHDVHRPKPVVFQTRWALSYLRGPLGLSDVANLMGPHKAARPAPAEAPKSKPAARAEDRAFREQLQQSAAPVVPPASVSSGPPILAGGVAQFFLPARPAAQPGLVCRPRLLAFASVHFADKKRNLNYRRSYRLLADAPPPDHPANWATAESLPRLAPSGQPELFDVPNPGATYEGVPDALNTLRKVKALQKTFADWLYSNARMALSENELVGTSEPGEDAASFRRRCDAEAERRAEQELADERHKYETARAALTAKYDTPAEPKASAWDWPVLSWFKPGPTVVHLGGVPANSTDAKKLRELDEAWARRKLDEYKRWRRTAGEVGDVLLTPRRADIEVTHFGLAWAPFRADGRPAYRV